MKTIDYIDLLKEKTDRKSVYAVAKLLGVSTSVTTQWTKHGYTFSDETALKVAKVLKVSEEKVIIDMALERAKGQKVISVWKNIAATLPTLCVMLGSSVYILC